MLEPIGIGKAECGRKNVAARVLANKVLKIIVMALGEEVMNVGENGLPNLVFGLTGKLANGVISRFVLNGPVRVEYGAQKLL